MEQQRIVCAAIECTEGLNIQIILGVRHFDTHMYLTINTIVDARVGFPYIGNSNSIQGFIDNTGKFLDRKEAFKVAEAAGQIIKKTGLEDSKELYSEDLY